MFYGSLLSHMKNRWREYIDSTSRPSIKHAGGPMLASTPHLRQDLASRGSNSVGHTTIGVSIMYSPP